MFDDVIGIALGYVCVCYPETAREYREYDVFTNQLAIGNDKRSIFSSIFFWQRNTLWFQHHCDGSHDPIFTEQKNPSKKQAIYSHLICHPLVRVDIQLQHFKEEYAVIVPSSFHRVETFLFTMSWKSANLSVVLVGVFSDDDNTIRIHFI